MYGKIILGCELVVRTGMHIGGSSVFSAIGAVDSPVIKDALTNQPIVPGSSLKGKLRTLLARSAAKDIENMPSHNEDGEDICRLFGSSNPVRTAQVQFADAFICNAEEFKEIGLTEVKFENSINRRDCVANPRQIERVVPGVRFAVRIVYDVHGNLQDVEKDMKLLASGMKLLQLDYLGGHGTRGSGRVSFDHFHAKTFGCELPANSITAIFKDVENYELLPL